MLGGNRSRSHATSSYSGDRTDEMSSRNCHYHEPPAKSTSSTPVRSSDPSIVSIFSFTSAERANVFTFVGLSVCLSVNKITKNVVDRFS